MITILHGDDIVSSRKFFIEQKSKSKNPITIEGSQITLTDLTQALEGSSLFGSDESVFIENLFAKKKIISKEFKELSLFLTNHSDAEVYIWESKELSKTAEKAIKNSKALVFAFPKSIFKFVDSLKPGNGRESLVLFHETLQNAEPEVILSMIVRQFRLMLAISDESGDSIEELKRIQPWQSGKLKSQARLFGIEKLKKIHSQLFDIDLGIKTGRLTNLTRAIDFLLVGI